MFVGDDTQKKILFHRCWPLSLMVHCCASFCWIGGSLCHCEIKEGDHSFRPQIIASLWYWSFLCGKKYYLFIIIKNSSFAMLFKRIASYLNIKISPWNHVSKNTISM